MRLFRTLTSCAIVASAIAALLACVGDDPGASDSTPNPGPSGKESGPCYPNNTCDDGLTCVSSVCVDPKKIDANVVIAPESGATTDATTDAPSNDAPNACVPSHPTGAVITTTPLRLTGVDFGLVTSPQNPHPWKEIGFDRDDKCSKNGDSDLCQSQGGGPSSGVEDGLGGIDNAFGEVLSQFSNITTGTNEEIFLQLNNGNGQLYIQNAKTQLIVPLTYGQLVVSGGAGTLSAIVPTDALRLAVRVSSVLDDSTLCSNPATLDAIGNQVNHSSDILKDGTQSNTKTCDAITLGVKFTGSSPGSTNARLDPCGGG